MTTTAPSRRQGHSSTGASTHSASGGGQPDSVAPIFALASSLANTYVSLVAYELDRTQRPHPRSVWYRISQPEFPYEALLDGELPRPRIDVRFAFEQPSPKIDETLWRLTTLATPCEISPRAVLFDDLLDGRPDGPGWTPVRPVGIPEWISGQSPLVDA